MSLEEKFKKVLKFKIPKLSKESLAAYEGMPQRTVPIEFPFRLESDEELQRKQDILLPFLKDYDEAQHDIEIKSRSPSPETVSYYTYKRVYPRKSYYKKKEKPAPPRAVEYNLPKLVTEPRDGEGPLGGWYNRSMDHFIRDVMLPDDKQKQTVQNVLKVRDQFNRSHSNAEILRPKSVKKISSSEPKISDYKIRVRFLHYLAAKPQTKSELYERVNKEGIRAQEKPIMRTVLEDIAIKDTQGIYSLKILSWFEVDFRFPFYSTQESDFVKRLVQVKTES